MNLLNLKLAEDGGGHVFQSSALMGTTTFLREAIRTLSRGEARGSITKCKEHLRMVQGIQPLLSDQVSQDLLHFPREGERTKKSFSMNICRRTPRSMSQQREKMSTFLRPFMQRGNTVSPSNLLCDLCFL